ncbi:cytochrome C oxidase subunit IV family protein [Gordonia polyisoprenivorans]|uniref:cytochrome C oxidase subunit IV family protein n=1 Tax=Gordonia polyisoprenivorans TaxID=84595 RepID=UPI001AD744D1|nr:cytochrome C oxidase subunit IV family protein [Gordonia polyisoprenivorans]
MTLFVSGRRSVTVWALLVLATLATWLISRDVMAVHVMVTLIMGVAMVKAFVVMWEYMEVRSAPRSLQVAVCTWLVVTFVVIVGMEWILI